MGEPRAEGREFGRAGRTARGVERIFGAILDIVAAIGAAEIDVPARSLAAKAAGELEVGFLQRVVRREAVGIDLHDVLVAVRAAAGLADENGRASCRERGCHYV